MLSNPSQQLGYMGKIVYLDGQEIDPPLYSWKQYERYLEAKKTGIPALPPPVEEGEVVKDDTDELIAAAQKIFNPQPAEQVDLFAQPVAS